MIPKIYVSPSDQVRNAYAAGNTNEAVQCRKIAQELVAALMRCGMEAMTNLTASMADRVNESNLWGATLHVCLHTNAFNEQVSGTRIFSADTVGEGYAAAKAVFDRLAPVTPGTSENIKPYPELYEIRNTNAPCVYVEVDFHDVDEVALWIIDHTEDIAEAICHGICDHYGYEYSTTEKDSSQVEERYYLLSEVPTAYREETIDRLVNLGIIRGRSGYGEDLVLDLGEDAIRILIYLDRAGVFPA